MKIKYIFSMVAGLFVLATTSCSEKTTTDTDADKETSEVAAETKTPEETPDVAEVEAPIAYYVMFAGKG
jgi:uncharacterized lipoprotein